MKKLFLNLFIAGALTFGLQSCGEDDPCDDVTCPTGEICKDGDCITDPNVVQACDFCGNYTGTITGNVGVSGVLADTTFTSANPLNATIIVSEDGNDYNIELDLSSWVPGVKPNATGTYNGNNNRVEFDNVEYTFNISSSSSLDFIINGYADFSVTDNIDANFILSSPAGSQTPANGDLVFVGTK